MGEGTLRRVALAFLTASLLATWAAGTAFAGTTLNPAPLELARAAVATPTIVTGATYESSPPFGTPTAVSTDELASFPTGGAGSDYAVLTTGDAALAGSPNDSGSTGRADGGGNVRGNTDYDVTILRIAIDVPGTANCLVGMDFRFLSDEYPEYVGTRYNDAFIAELDHSTWKTNGSEIDAPDNFAFDPNGNPITINAAGVTSMTAENAAGTTYDGATPLLTAATPVTPGAHVLYLSIFDQGDDIFDSAVFIDNLRFGHVGDVARDCKAGADLAGARKVVGLGDSYSSGYGMEPFFAGTHKDGTSNDCQRSQLAYAPLLASAIGVDLDFHACQGAVTADFYASRADGTWGELPQLDYVDDDTSLVTFSIGGNDAHFADVLAECILGFELLPFNTCYNDDKVTKPVAEAFARLDGQTSEPASTIPYDTLLKDVRARSPHASRVQVGYPPFFTAGGSDRTFLPGGRCEGVKKADQRWMVEKIAEMNGIIARNDARNGFVFADPTTAFSGHELCSGNDEWFYPIRAAGKFHPTQPGHLAMAQTVVNALAAHGDLPSVVLGPHQTYVYHFTAGGALRLLSIIIEWPGSDVELSLTSPSGKVYTRSAPGNGVYHAKGPTWEQFQIPSPEAGEWTATLFGADVKPAGEKVTIDVDQELPPNKRPVGAIALSRNGARLVLDGSGSHDPDGTIASWDWYVSTATSDDVYTGKTVSIPAVTDPESITLVVTDNGGLTDFVSVDGVLPIDVKPGSSENPITVGSKGNTPVALLSTAALDATKLDATKLRFGPGNASTAPQGVHNDDVNGDGRLDLMLQFPTQDMRVTAGMTTLCMHGELPGGRSFQACDSIRTT
jgi:lysophospholipase L1-like esterase